MALLYKDDLTKVEDFANSILLKEETEAQKMINQIDDFLSLSANKLKGEVWDNEREKLILYKEAFEKRKNVAILLLGTIKSANMVMLNYINSFPKGLFGGLNFNPNEINTTMINELNNEISLAQSHLSSVEENSSDINYYQSIINDCRTLALYIEKMSSVDQDAYSKFDEVVSEMADFISFVEGIGISNAEKIAPHSEKNDMPSLTRYYNSNSAPVNNNNNINLSIENTSLTQSNNDSVQPSNSVISSTHPSSVSSPVTINRVANEIESDNVLNQQERVLEDVKDTNSSQVVTTNDSVSSSEESNDNSVKVNHNVDNKTNKSTPKNNLGAIGLATAGVAVAGAAAYGTYNAIKHVKENENIDDDDDDDGQSDY